VSADKSEGGEIVPQENTLAQTASISVKELELLKSFISNQKSEIEIRHKELEIRSDENKASSEFAHASLNAMAADRKEVRVTSCTKLNATYIFSGIVVFLLLALAAYALSLGKTDLVAQVIDTVSKVGLGAIGGWGLAQAQAGRKEQKSKDDESD
jgi:hypothetical protein